MERLLLTIPHFKIESCTSTSEASNVGEALHGEQTENEIFIKDLKFVNNASTAVDSVK